MANQPTEEQVRAEIEAQRVAHLARVRQQEEEQKARLIQTRLFELTQARRLAEAEKEAAQLDVLEEQFWEGVHGLQRIASVGEISPDDLYIDTNCLLGQGAYAKVFKANLLGHTVAAKVFTKSSAIGLTSTIQNVSCELDVFQNLGKRFHEKIVQFYGVCILEKQLVVVMEYVDGADLFARIHKNGEQQFWDDAKKLDLVAQLAEAIAFIHESGVIHRDIKSSNILLTHSGLIKVADFGVSTNISAQVDDAYHSHSLPPENTKLSSDRGSPMWMAPEMMLSQRYTSACDVYSFALVCFEILAGKLPYHADWDLAQLKSFVASEYAGRPVLDQVRLFQDVSFDNEIKDLLRRCWHQDMTQRPTMSGVLSELQAMIDESSVHRAISESLISEQIRRDHELAERIQRGEL